MSYLSRIFMYIHTKRFQPWSFSSVERFEILDKLLFYLRPHRAEVDHTLLNSRNTFLLILLYKEKNLKFVVFVFCVSPLGEYDKNLDCKKQVKPLGLFMWSRKKCKIQNSCVSRNKIADKIPQVLRAVTHLHPLPLWIWHT